MTCVRLLGGAVLLLVLLQGVGGADSDPLAAQLAAGLEKRAALDTLRRYTLTLKAGGGFVLRRRVSILSKRFDDRIYVIGAFFHPKDLRGTAFLGVDRGGKADRFVYFPAFRIVRRIGAQQKSDSWFGTDLSLEDIEYRPIADFEILGSEEGVLEGEPVRAIDTRPLYGSSYERIRFHVAVVDAVILRTEYFAPGRSEARKIVTARREGMLGGVPAEVVSTNLETETSTEVTLDSVEFEPDIGREFFSTRTLEMWSKLKSLE